MKAAPCLHRFDFNFLGVFCNLLGDFSLHALWITLLITLWIIMWITFYINFLGDLSSTFAGSFPFELQPARGLLMRMFFYMKYP